MADGRSAILVEDKSQWHWTRGYVEDVAHAVVLAIKNEQSQGKVYNVGEAEALMEAEWIRQIGEAAGWSGQVVVMPKDSLPSHLKREYDWSHHLATDTSRIRHELGYYELIPRVKALWETVTWERSHPPLEVDMHQFDYAAEDTALDKYSG